MKEDKEIINWADEEYAETGWDDIVNEIKDRCKLDDADYISMKIVSDFGYKRRDAHVPEPYTYYQITSDLYEDLAEIVDGEDCKNGCQLYQEPDGTYYFQITGSNFYDKENNYAGTDTVKVWFKEFVW